MCKDTVCLSSFCLFLACVVASITFFVLSTVEQNKVTFMVKQNLISFNMVLLFL